MEGKPPAVAGNDDIGDVEAEPDTTLLNVQKILTEHVREFPLVLPVRGEKMIFRIVPQVRIVEIKQNHAQYLKNGGEEAQTRVLRIIEKKEEDRNPEEVAFMEQFNRDSWPYISEVYHAMLKEPKVDLNEFRLVMERLPELDQAAIYRHCDALMRRFYLGSKNLCAPPSGQ